MPKAAVNKDGKTLAAEDKVRPTRERRVTPPTGNLVRSQDHSQPEFRSFIAPRSDGRHHLRPLLFCKYVGHVIELTLGGEALSCGSYCASGRSLGVYVKALVITKVIDLDAFLSGGSPSAPLLCR